MLPDREDRGCDQRFRWLFQQRDQYARAVTGLCVPQCEKLPERDHENQSAQRIIRQDVKKAGNPSHGLIAPDHANESGGTMVVDPLNK